MDTGLEMLDQVVLTSDLPEHGLRVGDLGTIVAVRSGNESFDVQFSTFFGETVAVVTLDARQLRPVSAQDMLRARSLDVV